MGCVHLLDTARVLKPWNQIGYCHLHFLLHSDFCIVLGFYPSNHQNPISQTSRHWNEDSTIKCWNCELSLHSAQQMSLCFPRQLKIRLGVLWGTWGMSGYSLGTRGSQSFSISLFSIFIMLTYHNRWYLSLPASKNFHCLKYLFPLQY